MGLSRLTALVIKNNDVRCEAGGPDDDGKYMGWIMKDEDRWRPLLNSDAVYSTKESAIVAMQGIVDWCRKADLTSR